MPGCHDGNYVMLNIDINTGKIINWDILKGKIIDEIELYVDLL